MKINRSITKIFALLILAVLLCACGKDLPEGANPEDATLSGVASDGDESNNRSDTAPADSRPDIASGSTGTASGSQDKSSDSTATASGSQDKSSDSTATASGSQDKSSGNTATASGSQDKSSGSTATASGSQDKSSGSTSTASGSQDKSSGNTTASGSPGVSLPSVSGALRVEGTRLTDSNGQPIQLKGISTHGLAWFPGYVNEACFRQLREDWNANVVRLAMYTAENGGYCTGGDQNALKELVQNGVAYATAQDLYVIIDWHILSDGNPGTYLEQAKDFFGEMAELYAASDNVLYEICNEPNGGVSWSEIKSYAEEVISVIRDHDEDGVIIVGTPNWSQYVDQAAADPITGYDNIMYALHFYAATHKDSLRSTMTAAIDAGLPVFVTEYGICDASGNGAIDESQANQWVNTMNAYGVSYVAWNLSNKNETSAILSNQCSKTSDFTEEDLSASGKWLYAMLTGQSSEGSSPRHEDSPAPTPGADAQTPRDNTSQNREAEAQTAICGEEALSCSASLQNSWESDGKTYYQYELTLQNNSSSDCDSWTVDIPFSESFSLSDGWNGEYTVSGDSLHIVCKDYNAHIPSGGSAGNIGFIVYGSGSLHIID